MTFFRSAMLAVLSVAVSQAWLTGALADEDAMHAYNLKAATRHDIAMYDLVDELSACAGFYSMIEPRFADSERSRDAREQKTAFVLLGADALKTISPGPRSDRLLEMQARLDISRKDLLNTFGSLGGLLETDTGDLEERCDKLRRSKRSFFGWTVRRED